MAAQSGNIVKLYWEGSLPTSYNVSFSFTSSPDARLSAFISKGLSGKRIQPVDFVNGEKTTSKVRLQASHLQSMSVCIKELGDRNIVVPSPAPVEPQSKYNIVLTYCDGEVGVRFVKETNLKEQRSELNDVLTQTIRTVINANSQLIKHRLQINLPEEQELAALKALGIKIVQPLIPGVNETLNQIADDNLSTLYDKFLETYSTAQQVSRDEQLKIVASFDLQFYELLGEDAYIDIIANAIEIKAVQHNFSTEIVRGLAQEIAMQQIETLRRHT